MLLDCKDSQQSSSLQKLVTQHDGAKASLVQLLNLMMGWSFLSITKQISSTMRPPMLKTSAYRNCLWFFLVVSLHDRSGTVLMLTAVLLIQGMCCVCTTCDFPMTLSGDIDTKSPSLVTKCVCSKIHLSNKHAPARHMCACCYLPDMSQQSDKRYDITYSDCL